FALLYIDIDHFKVINDSMGHDAGDQLLTSMTQRLQKNLRQTDTIARLGGDEFTLILDNLSDAESAISITQNLLELLALPMAINGRDVHTSGSIGIAMYPDDGDSFGSLLKNADTAMYRAKEMGRNTFQFYTAEMSALAMRRLELEQCLRQAIDREELVLFYQPKFNLTTGQCSGMEALVRWQHPEKGLIPPDEFIPLAEETGLIVALGDWVIRQACKQMSEWKRNGYSIHNISINVSARQFHEQDLCGLFEKMLEEYQLVASEIEIELTESILVEDRQKNCEVLDRLHAMGLKIALDDFGTGYASMSNLKDFPIDTVKIDRSFVSGLPEDRESIAIVKAISSLSNALELSLIAEGVETEHQIAFLKSNACFQGQGYFWSKAVSAEEFEKTILMV
ncbi:MAG: EAL domain-containing protein, partial [Gammaproteobacteria bacterium]|nr:EAL domain-containing protein [Gammaproteobacteria bacterium]